MDASEAKVGYYVRNVTIQMTHFVTNLQERIIIETWAMQTFLPAQTALKSARLEKSNLLFGQRFGEQFEEQEFGVRQLKHEDC